MLNFLFFILQFIGFILLLPVCIWLFTLMSLGISLSITIFGIRGAFEDWKEKHK